MPFLEKQTISNFLRSDCLRRLRLDLSPDTRTYQAERVAANMPPRAVRPGLQALAAAGDEWETQKLNDLADTFGRSALVGNIRQNSQGRLQFNNAALQSLLPQANPGCFITQAQFQIGNTFTQSLGLDQLATQHNLTFSQLRPDIIQLLSPRTATQAITPTGDVVDVAGDDTRTPLRVIDIKLTAEPSVPYFIESAYYNVALAGWLVDHQLQDHFFVSCSTTVWPGSHDASEIVQLVNEHNRLGTTPSRAELEDALERDLESGDFRIFAPRLRRFFNEDLPRALSTSWTTLPWHVDNRCIGCEYLGYPWPGATPDTNHCWSHASQQDHLSRVAFITRGARGVLEDNQIGDVAALAATQPSAAAFDAHHTLRATRTVVAGRASALTSGIAGVPTSTGTSAVMPAWADLRLYITADFDIGSGITVAFGVSSVWAVNQQSVPAGRHYSRTQPQVFPVDQRSLQVEARELGNMLNAIDDAMRTAQNLKADATVQVYVWDTLTYDHLVRVIGRHLATFIQNRQLRRLAWLFPPDTVVPNPTLSDRMSPVTIVRDVVRAVVAAPVPHYYSLLNIARAYHSSHTQAPYDQFVVPGLFEDPLSDQVPSERAHEIWSRSGGSRPWNQQLQQLDRTVRVRLSALESVAQRVREDLQGQLNRTAPRIEHLRPPSLPQRMADDARLWYVFAQLNAALDHLEKQKTQAMPPHEREARFQSARLAQRLTGTAEQQALTASGLHQRAGRRVYRLSRASTEVRAKEGDFTFALSPEARPGFLSESLRRVAGNITLPLRNGQNEWIKMEWVTQVTIAHIDRDAGWIAVDINNNWLQVIETLEQAGIIDLTQDVMLDPIYREFFVTRLQDSLNAIGNPPVAINNAVQAVTSATGQTRRPSRGAPSPVADVLWDAGALFSTSVSRNLGQIRSLLASNGCDLNESQWQAWEASLTHRLRLVWGPPGTGKSRTLRGIVLGALIEAAQTGRLMRVLVTGPTYEAIDNILIDLIPLVTGTGPVSVPTATVARLRSSTRSPNPSVPAIHDVPTQASNAAYSALRQSLANQSGVVLVGATAQQAHKLLVDSGSATSELFDLVLIDEASQVDIATACLPLAGLAAGGSVVVAGDPKQLPPIHRAEAPLDLEYMVGPVFSYLEQRFSLEPEVLSVNYRSCRDLVTFAYLAEYPRELTAHSPDLRLNYIAPLHSSANAPAQWPSGIHWCEGWADLLNPEQPATCFVYPEGRSSQWNEFEAQAITALCSLLANSMGNRLDNERDPSGSAMAGATGLYQADQFWSRGVGIVTPHRAQQALVVARLQAAFPSNQYASIRSAVDTVERFQGQQRDVIIATFALGDPDAISDEDEFLLSLNRFNVMASRARAKLIVLVSQEVVDHLSSDMDVLRGSALLKSYVDSHCSAFRELELGYVRDGTDMRVSGMHRWHE